jgi:RNA polymerase sigma-70 factor, ECF subfamily
VKDQLAIRIQLGDEHAFELMFRKYFVHLCCFANKFVDDPDLAQEIVQDVFTKIWENREDIDPELPLKGYLFKIVRNLSLNKLQRRKVESKYTEIYKQVYSDHSEFSVHESLLARELENNIAIAIDKLPAQCKKIFELSRSEGLKYSEIATTLNISVKTVETQMSRALKSLRYELSEYLTVIILLLIFNN